MLFAYFSAYFSVMLTFLLFFLSQGGLFAMVSIKIIKQTIELKLATYYVLCSIFVLNTLVLLEVPIDN